jgi:hypothetical protein
VFGAVVSDVARLDGRPELTHHDCRYLPSSTCARIDIGDRARSAQLGGDPRHSAAIDSAMGPTWRDLGCGRRSPDHSVTADSRQGRCRASLVRGSV